MVTVDTLRYPRDLSTIKCNAAAIYRLYCISQVLGMGEEWRGGDVKRYPGGGHKINILKKETELHKNESDLLLMFVDR